MNELHLFAGAGGGILGGILLGHTCVCAVEIEPYCRKILLQRQRDGILPKFPIWDDVRTFDGKPWRGKVDVVCGGFPCQDISYLGKGAGIEGPKSGLWKEMFRVVCEVGPKIVFVENSPALTYRGLGRVLADLARLGYDARWGMFCAADVGAIHERKRIFIAAYDLRWGSDKLDSKGVCVSEARQRGKSLCSTLCSFNPMLPGSCWPQPLLRGVDAKMARALDRCKAIGNGQVPEVVKLAWETLMPQQ